MCAVLGTDTLMREQLARNKTILMGVRFKASDKQCIFALGILSSGARLLSRGGGDDLRSLYSISRSDISVEKKSSGARLSRVRTAHFRLLVS